MRAPTRYFRLSPGESRQARRPQEPVSRANTDQAARSGWHAASVVLVDSWVASADSVVWAMLVVKRLERSQHYAQVPFARDEQTAQAFAAYGADEPLGVGVRRGAWIRGVDDPETARREHRAEPGREPRVPIVYVSVTCCRSGDCQTAVHSERLPGHVAASSAGQEHQCGGQFDRITLPAGQQSRGHRVQIAVGVVLGHL